MFYTLKIFNIMGYKSQRLLFCEDKGTKNNTESLTNSERRGCFWTNEMKRNRAQKSGLVLKSLVASLSLLIKYTARSKNCWGILVKAKSTNVPPFHCIPPPHVKILGTKTKINKQHDTKIFISVWKLFLIICSVITMWPKQTYLFYTLALIDLHA